MGIGRAKGENRVIESVRQAVSSPLLETTIEGAKSVILNVTGGKDLMLSEVNEAAVLVQGIIDEKANIIFGATIDESMTDEVKITVIATGFSSNVAEEENKQIEVKPIFQTKERIVDNSLPPLLREIEQEEQKIQTAQEIQAVVETPVEVAPVIEQVEEEVPEERKGRELPAFMRKLFRK